VVVRKKTMIITKMPLDKFLGVTFCEPLEMDLFISPNTFLGVEKHRVFERKI